VLKKTNLNPGEQLPQGIIMIKKPQPQGPRKNPDPLLKPTAS